MLAIAWQYLSGRATAKEIDDHQKAEWPPHPDRVFQALVAAWGERDCPADERAALEWLEQQDAPRLAAPEAAESAVQVTQVFVPVNDTAGPNRGDYAPKHLALLPERRSRKERSFATIHVGDETCAMIWPLAEPPPAIRAALASVCASVTHVGHSRSLVRMWVEDAPPAAVWEPAAAGHRFRRDHKLRVPHQGRLARLEKAYAEFTAGRLARNAWPVSQWRDYVRCVTPDTTPRGDFDQRLIVLRRVGGEGRPDLVQAPAFVRALRETLMSKADGNAKAMPWISGHEPDGRPCQRPHVAALPLAHVGHEHADGHLLGMGIAFPRGMPADDEHAVSEVIAHTMDSEGQIELKAGALGTMLLKAEDGPSPAYALRSATWTRASLCWGTVTPIALDRLPPRRHEGDDAWVAAQVVAACERQGLPAPVEVCILPVSPHIGAPTCGAFPPLRRKPDGANRWHVHAVLVFARLVEGPLALGAGRYQGYGLLKPLAGAERGRASAADAAQVPMHTPSS